MQNPSFGFLLNFCTLAKLLPAGPLAEMLPKRNTTHKIQTLTLGCFYSKHFTSTKYNLNQIFDKKFQTIFISRGNNVPDFRDKANLYKPSHSAI